jgi:hypothetical protein
MRINKRYTRLAFSIVTLAFVIGLVVSRPSAAFAQELQNDDLLVGAGGSSGLHPGTIWRLRGGSLVKFCQESPAKIFAPPYRVMVDAQGRVVFLATLQSPNDGFPHVGLFRCNALGAVPQLLAVFPGLGDPAPGDPVPFPVGHYLVSGLHLARVASATIDDQVNDGRPQLGTDDLYVLVLGQFNPNPPFETLGVRTVRYHTASGRWDEGPAPCEGADCPPRPSGLSTGIYAINHGGVTYFSYAGNILRRVKDPLQTHISGRVGGIDFDLRLSLFGGAQKFFGPVLDYVNLPHTPSGCPPAPPVSNDMPPGIFVMSGFFDVVFDEFGGLGLVLASNSGSIGSAFPANVSEALMDKPDDLSQYFQNGNFGCQVTPAVKANFIMPLSGPAGNNTLGNLVSAPSGLAGTQGQQVARVAPGSDQLEVLASHSMFPDLVFPNGLGAFPATASVGGVVISIRIDSPVNVLVTGPDGRRIGVDPDTGLFVNEFRDDAFDSGPGEPRFYALRNAAPGDYSVQSVATADGPFAVHVYSADPAQPLGNHIVGRGIVSIGDINTHDFTLDPTGGIVFLSPATAAKK